MSFVFSSEMSFLLNLLLNRSEMVYRILYDIFLTRGDIWFKPNLVKHFKYKISKYIFQGISVRP